MVRFVEFAHTNSKEFENNVHIFSIVAELFNISEDEFRDILAFITDSVSSNIIVIDGKNETGDFENHISRIGMEGHITVLLIKRFEKYIFTYRGAGLVVMTETPLTRDSIYACQLIIVPNSA